VDEVGRCKSVRYRDETDTSTCLVSYRHYKERGPFIRRKITFTQFVHRKHENRALKFKYSELLYGCTVTLDFQSYSNGPTNPLNAKENFEINEI
jgi:hypothetical protein